MDVPFKRLRPEGALPSTQHPGDAGLDLRAAIDATVRPGERVMVPTGVAVAIPDGHAGLVLPRSGLATARGLTLSNSPGLIDAGYRGEVICSVVNLDRGEAVEIRAGDRIAQPGAFQEKLARKESPVELELRENPRRPHRPKSMDGVAVEGWCAGS